MKIKTILLLVAVLASVSYGQDQRGTADFVDALELSEFAHLKRLYAALERMKFPKPENRILTWKQNNVAGAAAQADPGIGITIDADKRTLGSVAGVWSTDWKGYDLAHVVVITKRGKQIQFVDMTDKNVEKVKELPIGRGDAVIFLKKQNTR